MKQFIFKPLFLALSLSLVLASCSSDDDFIASENPPTNEDDDNNDNNDDENSQGIYDLGFIVANEGNFGSPNASVSYISADLENLENNIFNTANTGENVGDVLNSIAFDDDYAFLVVNNSNKVLVVNRYTFELEATLTQDIDMPRFAGAENGKLYISNSGSQSIAIYNTNNFSFESAIALDKPVEQLEIDNGYLYVQNAAFNTGNEITVINLSNNQVETTLTVGDGLNSIDVENGVLYALSAEGIATISTTSNNLTGTINFTEGFTGGTKLDVENNEIYFISGSKIYNYAISATELTDTPLMDTQVNDESWFLGYGFAVENDKIFYSNVNGFTANSEVYVYDLEGNLEKTLTTGIGANNFYFND